MHGRMHIRAYTSPTCKSRFACQQRHTHVRQIFHHLEANLHARLWLNNSSTRSWIKLSHSFNILLNIIQSSYIAIMFLRAVFSIFALQMIFQTPKQSCWCSDASKDGPVSSSSQHVLERLPSALWVVGSVSLATLCSSYTHTGSALRVMVNGLARAGDSATH